MRSATSVTAVVLAGIAVGAVGMSLTIRRPEVLEPAPQKTPAPPAAVGPSQPPAVTTDFIADLAAHRWTANAATQLGKLLRDACGDVPLDFGTQHPAVAACLRSLGDHPQAMPLLERRPEIAPLLAVQNDAKVIDRLITILDSLDDHEYWLAEGWFKQHPVGSDMLQLIDALENPDDRQLLFELTEKNLLGVERLLMCPGGNQANRDFRNWIVGVLKHLNTPMNPGKREIAIFTFLLAQSHDIRERLANDDAFRRDFASISWNRFVNLAEPDSFDAYAALPGVWEVLAINGGAELIKKYRAIPYLLLFSAERLPEELADKVKQALRSDDRPLIVAMLACGRNTDFHHLLKRKGVTESARRGVIRELATSNANDRDGVLAHARKLTDPADFDREYGGRDEIYPRDLPLGNAVVLADKLASGRRVYFVDVVAGGLDVLDVALMFVSPGPGAASKIGFDVLTHTVGEVKGQVGKYAAEHFLRDLDARGLPRGITADRMAGDLAAASQDAFALSVILQSAHYPTQADSEARACEITSLLQLIALQTGKPTASFLWLKHADARFILREKGRLFASLGRNKLDSALVGENSLAHSRVRTCACDETDPASIDQAWRCNTFAWWLAQLAGRYER